jgi:hypothetical protein
MLWAIHCTDKPNTAAIREKVVQPHRDYLQSQKGILVLAGATQNDEGTQATGSLFIVNRFPTAIPSPRRVSSPPSPSRACARDSGIPPRRKARRTYCGWMPATFAAFR